MRSDQIHRALAQGMNRFEVCRLVAKGVRVTHKTGSRFEDTINDALEYLGSHPSTQQSMHGPHSRPNGKTLESAA
jgi:uncharacterized protein YoaH (UPF0181 family)